eukprot:946636-Ditylum_brightwellii.AAC.1
MGIEPTTLTNGPGFALPLSYFWSVVFQRVNLHLFIHHLDDVAAVNGTLMRFMPRYSSRARGH